MIRGVPGGPTFGEDPSRVQTLLGVPFAPSTCKIINSRKYSSIWTKHYKEIIFIVY